MARLSDVAGRTSSGKMLLLLSDIVGKQREKVVHYTRRSTPHAWRVRSPSDYGHLDRAYSTTWLHSNSSAVAVDAWDPSRWERNGAVAPSVYGKSTLPRESRLAEK